MRITSPKAGIASSHRFACKSETARVYSNSPLDCWLGVGSGVGSGVGVAVGSGTGVGEGGGVGVAVGGGVDVGIGVGVGEEQAPAMTTPTMLKTMKLKIFGAINSTPTTPYSYSRNSMMSRLANTRLTASCNT